MEREQYEEWYALQRQATEMLRTGAAPKRTAILRLFQLLVLPSLDSAVGWEVCRDQKPDTRHFAVRSVWNRELDGAKMETPVVRLRYLGPLHPTIEVREFALDDAWADAVTISLKRVVIPVMVDDTSVGLDGTSYEMAVGSAQAHVRYHWWETPPAEWRTMDAWLHETLNALELLR